MLRNALLYLSNQPRVFKFVRTNRIAKGFASRFVAGETLDSAVADKVFFYYAPKILGGLESLPVAGGIGRRRRVDAILLNNVNVHSISKDEFAVEAWVVKEQASKN